MHYSINPREKQKKKKKKKKKKENKLRRVEREKIIDDESSRQPLRSQNN